MVNEQLNKVKSLQMIQDLGLTWASEVSETTGGGIVWCYVVDTDAPLHCHRVPEGILESDTQRQIKIKIKQKGSRSVIH